VELQLTAERVNQIFMDVQVEIGGRIVQGIYITVHLDETKLEAYDQEIDAMLAQLPDAFRSQFGAAFPYMAQHKDGHMWAMGPLELDRLLIMAMALNKCWVSRKQREVLGMPDNTPFVRIY
jgi:hypothetical protein